MYLTCKLIFLAQKLISIIDRMSISEMSLDGARTIYWVKAQLLHQNRTIYFSRPFTSFIAAQGLKNELINFVNALGLAWLLSRVASISVDSALI